jgi:hypothetical protein
MRPVTRLSLRGPLQWAESHLGFRTRWGRETSRHRRSLAFVMQWRRAKGAREVQSRSPHRTGVLGIIGEGRRRRQDWYGLIRWYNVSKWTDRGIEWGRIGGIREEGQNGRQGNDYVISHFLLSAFSFLAFYTHGTSISSIHGLITITRPIAAQTLCYSNISSVRFTVPRHLLASSFLLAGSGSSHSPRLEQKLAPKLELLETWNAGLQPKFG